MVASQRALVIVGHARRQTHSGVALTRARDLGSPARTCVYARWTRASAIATDPRGGEHRRQHCRGLRGVDQRGLRQVSRFVDQICQWDRGPFTQGKGPRSHLASWLANSLQRDARGSQDDLWLSQEGAEKRHRRSPLTSSPPKSDSWKTDETRSSWEWRGAVLTSRVSKLMSRFWSGSPDRDAGQGPDLQAEL